MPIVAFLPAIAAGLGGVLSGIGASKGRTTTGTSSQQGTSTTTQNQDPMQQQVYAKLFKQLIAQLRQGPQVSEGDRNQARLGINQNYDAANQSVESNLASRGYGESGKVGTAFRNNSLERANQFQTTENTLQNQSQNRFQQLLSSVFAFLQPRSSTTTGNSSGTQSQTQPGQPWQSVFGGGLSDLASLAFLHGMTGGGGDLPTGSTNVPGGSGFWNVIQNTPSFGAAPCAVAFELYRGDWRFVVVRNWLLKQAGASRKWAAFVLAYRILGRPAAAVVRRSKRARRVAKAYFDGLLIKAVNA